MVCATRKGKCFLPLAKNPILPDNKSMSKTLHEIEEAIETLPLPERLRLYKGHAAINRAQRRRPRLAAARH